MVRKLVKMIVHEFKSHAHGLPQCCETTGIANHWAFCCFCFARLVALSSVFIVAHWYSDSGIVNDMNSCTT